MILDKDNITQALRGKLKGAKAHQIMSPMDRELTPSSNNIANLRNSSVLVLLELKDNQLFTVLTKRAAQLRNHPGQISFPGGACEEGETMIETAIREAKEEIGISTHSIEIVRELSPLYVPVSNYIIHPVVAWSKQNDYSINSPDELDELILFPISEFINKLHCQKEIIIDKLAVKVPAYTINEHIVWGATAMIISELIELLKDYFLSNR